MAEILEDTMRHENNVGLHKHFPFNRQFIGMSLRPVICVELLH